MLFYKDSNLEFQDQNLTCYHYTIEQFYIPERNILYSVAAAKLYFYFN